MPIASDHFRQALSSFPPPAKLNEFFSSKPHLAGLPIATGADQPIKMLCQAYPSRCDDLQGLFTIHEYRQRQGRYFQICSLIAAPACISALVTRHSLYPFSSSLKPALPKVGKFFVYEYLSR